MVKVIKNADMARQAVRENEALRAENAALQAKLDYIAMMTDVELGEDENSTEGTENE